MSVASWHNTELCPLSTLDCGAPSIEAADTVEFMKLDSFHGFESEVAVAQDVALNSWQLIPSASSGLCAEPPVAQQAASSSAAPHGVRGALSGGALSGDSPSGVVVARHSPRPSAIKEVSLLSMTCPCDRTNVYKHSSVVLGAGTFGTVFATKHKDFETALVLKSFSKENLAVAMTEVYVLEKLGSHPNIVVFWDAWLGFRGQAHIVLERFGQSLCKALREAPPNFAMDLVGIRGITRDVARALCHVHAKGILHADLKPGNILTFGYKAKLCDWGSALEAPCFFSAWDSCACARLRKHVGEGVGGGIMLHTYVYVGDPHARATCPPSSFLAHSVRTCQVCVHGSFSTCADMCLCTYVR